MKMVFITQSETKRTII